MECQKNLIQESQACKMREVGIPIRTQTLAAMTRKPTYFKSFWDLRKYERK